MHKAFIMFSVFVLAVKLTSCSDKTISTCPGDWTGKYIYGEEPVKAIAGYAMTMQWELLVSDSCRGVLEVNGQQTHIKLLTTISGDTNSVAFIYDRLIDGSNNNLKKGDTLFILSKIAGKLITKWKELAPRLTGPPPEECNCFTFSKDNQ